nr:hypothetical protein [Methylophilus sp. 14]
MPEWSCCGLTRVLVTADQLLAAHRPAGLRTRRLTAQSRWNGTDLQAALPALLSQLPASRWRRIEVTIADKHVHLLRLPAMTQSVQSLDLSGQEQQAYARAILMQTYGEAARAWPFRLQDIQQPQDSLLVAIPALASLDINALLARHAMQWSVQPYASALWANTRLPATGTVLTAEPQMLRLLQLDQGHMTHVASLATEMTDVNAMAAWLMRERTLLGVQASSCYWLLEPGRQVMEKTGRSLKQALSGQVSWQVLPASRAVAPCQQELAHVA